MSKTTDPREYKRGYVAARRLLRNTPELWTRGGYDHPDAFDRGWRDGSADERVLQLRTRGADFSSLEKRIVGWLETPPTYHGAATGRFSGRGAARQNRPGDWSAERYKK